MPILSRKNTTNLLRRLFIAVFFLLPTIPLFSQNADSANYFLQKALAEKQTGSRVESVRQLEKALKYDTGNKAVLNELAAGYMEVRRHAEAIATLKKLEANGYATAANYKQLLELNLLYRQHDEVLLYAGKLKEADPSEKVDYYFGKVEYEKGNFGAAIQYLEKAAKENPADAEIPYLIGHCYAEMNNYKETITYYQKAVQLDTTKPFRIYELGLMYYAVNDHKNALKYILEAGNRGLTKDNDYMENLGNAYLNAGEAEEGIAIMQEVLKRKPSDLTILNSIAEAYYSKKKYQEAIDYWDRILSYDKQNASALYMIGLSFQKKGEKEKGQLLCDKAIEMDPSLGSLRQKRMMQGL